MTVEDRPAVRHQLDPLAVLHGGHAEEVRAAQHGEVDGARHDECKHTGEEGPRHQHPAARWPPRVT